MLHGRQHPRNKGVKCTHLCVCRSADEKFTPARARSDGWMDVALAVSLRPPVRQPAQPGRESKQRDSLLFNLQNDMLMAHGEISLCTAKRHVTCAE